MIVQLNGRDYIVVPRKVRRFGRDILVPVEEYKVEAFVDQFDTSGGQSQKQLRSSDSQVFPNFMLGFGRDRIASDSARNPDEYRRFFDCICDTRFEKIYLPILEENSLETGLEVVRAFANFKGDFWGIWEDDTSTDIVARKYTGSTTTWGGGGNVLATANTMVGLDVISHKTHMIALVAETNDHVIRRSSDGASWSAASTPITANLLTNNVTANEDINAGLLADIGGEAVAVIWHEANGTITFFSSTDAGDVWADEAVDIPSGDGPHGVAVYPGIDGEDKLYVLTMESLWEVDTAPATWTTQIIRPTPGGIAVYGRRMIVGDDGAVWFSVAGDDDTPAPFYRMIVSGDSRVIDPFGLNLGDGVPSDLLGPVRYMTSGGGFVFASLGGGKAARQARIVCWNSKGWHSMRQHGTANQKIEAIGISSRDDDLVRLHYAIRTGTATSNTKFLGQPLVNPASGVAIKRELTGIIDLPYIDGGMPLINAAWLRFGINASSLSSSNSGEFIQMKYGLNGAARTTSPATAFEFVSGTLTQDLPSGSTAGAGESARNIGTRVTLNRAATTVVFDAASSGNSSSASSQTVSHVVSTGSNRLIVVGVSAEDDVQADTVPTGVTYNGVALTKLGSGTRDISTGSEWVSSSIWYLVAPATGTNDIVATFNSTQTSIVVGGASFTAVDQTTPVGTMATDNATGTGPSVTVTAASDDIVIDALAANSKDITQTATVGSGQTQRWNTDEDRTLGAGSTEVATGSTVMSWTLGTSKAYVLLGVAVKPATANTATPELEDAVISYLKIPAKLKGYIFTVDVEQSTGNAEKVRTDLETADDLGTLPILTYARSGNRFVKVRAIRWFPDITEGGVGGPAAPDVLAQRGGYVDVTVEEVI